jgi:multidrug efflux pump subunit AcrB
MSLTKIAIEKKAVSWFGLFLITVAGIVSFFSLGQLEDPEFTIRSAIITTSYPGATAKEVELEVTDKIELVVQELTELDYVESWSRPGLSTVKAEIKAKYRSGEILQIWDLLRQKIRDVEQNLPPGASRPVITDDFGDVFGLLLAITSDGYSYQELDSYVKDVRKELSLVPGVARVDIWGKQDRAIYLDVRESQLAALGLSQASIEQTIRNQNAVVDAGHADVQDRRLRVAPTGQFTSAKDIEDLVVRPTLSDSLQARANPAVSGPVSDLIRIGDIGKVIEGYREPPLTSMRFNGQMAMALAIANQPGVNVVDMGRKVDARLAELIATLPVGIEVHRVHWQSDAVAQSVKGFFVSLAQAVVIVLAVLALAMGWRMGLVIGSGLILTYPWHISRNGDLPYRPSAYVIGGFGDCFGHDGRQRDCGRRRLRDSAAKGHGEDQGCHRSSITTRGSFIGRNDYRGDGVLSDLCIRRSSGRILRHSLHSRGLCPAHQLGDLDGRHTFAVPGDVAFS